MISMINKTRSGKVFEWEKIKNVSKTLILNTSTAGEQSEGNWCNRETSADD